MYLNQPVLTCSLYLNHFIPWKPQWVFLPTFPPLPPLTPMLLCVNVRGCGVAPSLRNFMLFPFQCQMASPRLNNNKNLQFKTLEMTKMRKESLKSKKPLVKYTVSGKLFHTTEVQLSQEKKYFILSNAIIYVNNLPH